MAGTQARGQAAARDQAALHNTRQLLDELDALMDQMLALPIDDPSEDDALDDAEAASAATISATLTVMEPDSSPAASESARADLTAPTDKPSAPPELGGAGSALPESVSAPILTEVAAPATVDLLPPPRRVPTARWRPDHISYRFLLWVNQGYDRATTWAGVPGRFLRSRSGKLILGLAGLGLLGVALAWLGRDWLGWNW
jgi:hypothetical protein